MKKVVFLFSFILFYSLYINGQDVCAPVGWATQNGGVTGGGSATPTVVSNYNDLKDAITSSSVKVVHISGTITIPSGGKINFQDQSDKTIYGLSGCKLISNDLSSGSSGILSVKRCHNIIIRNITFEGPAAYDVDGSDNLVLDNCTNVWVDHCEFQDGLDGNLDIKNASDYISVTWCKFVYNKSPIPDGPGGSDDHRFSNLFGSDDGATGDRGHLNITLQYCWWAQGCKARMPRVRFGKVHVVNNFFNSTASSSCVMAGFEADLLVESNVFENVKTPIDLMSGTYTAVTSRDNIYTTVTGNTSGNGTAFTPPYSLTISAASQVKSFVTAGAGATLTSPTCSGTNILPTVSITSPANGSNFTAPATIDLTADASDADGSVTQVQFYNGATLLHTDASAPYTFSWTNVAAGSYSITAKATDDDGAVANSIAVGVTVYSGSGFALQTEAYCNADGIVETEHAGYNGAGFLNLTNAIGSYATFAVNSSTAQNVDLAIRYASGSANNRNMSLMVNGATQIASVDFPSTGGWTNWSTVTVQVALVGGHNLITLTSLMNEGAANLDELFFSSTTVSSGDCNGTPNQSPTVSLTSPSDGASYSSPASITISANASDVDGSIANVEFLSGTIVIGSDASAPYSFDWSGVGGGTYEISARATDNFGVVVSSSSVTINVTGPVNQLPAVSITSPTNGASFITPSLVTIQASASDPDGVISKVQFYQGTTLLGEDLSFPYSYDWASVSPGNYNLTAVAIDDQSGQSTSSVVAITVVANQSSVVNITSPTANSTVSGTSVTISGTVSDPDGGISSVQVYDGTTLIGSSSSSPFDIVWNNPGDGSHTITIKVTDSHGGETNVSQTFAVQQTTTGLFTSSGKILSTALYPNPSAEVFKLTSSNEIKSIRVLNLQGLLLEEKSEIAAGQIVEVGEELVEGTYLLLVEYESGRIEVAKMVKIK